MHQYLETVRTEIEAASGEEAYLASALFWRAQQAIGYEDDGEMTLNSKEDFERIQNQVINSLPQDEFNLHEEILAWQAGILRHATKEFYHSWVEYKEEKFAAGDIFADGEACMALEASSEKIGGNPTENYTALLEVEQVLIKLCTAPNKTISELDRFWRFKREMVMRGETMNAFTEKRIKGEQDQSTLSASIRQLKEVSLRCRSNGKRLAGAHHILWMNAHMMLESITHVLDGFLSFEYMDDMELSMNNWLESLFPFRFEGGDPNPMYQSELHHQIIARLSQATQCLVQYQVRKVESFQQRDEIIIPFLKDVMEQVKRTSLQNIQVTQTDLLEEGTN